MQCHTNVMDTKSPTATELCHGSKSRYLLILPNARRGATKKQKYAQTAGPLEYRIPPGKTDGILCHKPRHGPINVEPPSMWRERVSGVTMSSSVVGGQTGLKRGAHMVVNTTAGRRNQQRISVPKDHPRRGHHECICRPRWREADGWWKSNS